MSTNLSLSFELLCLMGWLLRQHKEEVAALIASAVEKGFIDELEISDMRDFIDHPSMSNEMVNEFFSFLERTVQKQLEGRQIDVQCQGFLADEVKKIDGQFVDQRVLFASIQNVKKKLLLNSKEIDTLEENEQVKSSLCENILKQWNPSQQDQLN